MAVHDLWKTFLASYIAYFYFLKKWTIYSNVDFYFKNNPIRVNKKIQKITDIKYIEFQETKWLIIIDEWWLNANSRRSISSQNMEFAGNDFFMKKEKLWYCFSSSIRL